MESRFIKRSSGFVIKKKKKPSIDNRSEPLNNQKNPKLKKLSAHSHHEVQIDHSPHQTLKQTLALYHSQHHAATAASHRRHRRSENRLPPSPSRTFLSAIIGQNLLFSLSHTLFSSCDLSLGCVACVRFAVGLGIAIVVGMYADVNDYNVCYVCMFLISDFGFTVLYSGGCENGFARSTACHSYCFFFFF